MKSNERLKLLRSSLKKTQMEMATLLYTEQSTYCRWETGRTEMPLHIVHTICDKYKIDPHEFLGSPDITNDDTSDSNNNGSILQNIYTFPKELMDKLLDIISDALKFGDNKRTDAE